MGDPRDNDTALRVPPHSVEAEQSVLGALLLDNATFDAVGDALAEADFYRLEHQLIFGAIARLVMAGRPADVVTVHDALTEREREQVGGIQYVNALAASVATAQHAGAYAAIVRQRSVCRRVIAVADALAAEAWACGAADADRAAIVGAIDAAMLQLLALMGGERQGEPRQMVELLPGWLDALSARADGVSDAIPTGFRDIDRLMGGGPRRGDLIVIGARPSMGKSALSLGWSRSVAAVGPVLMLSMEDSDQMLVSRHVAAQGRVNLADIRNPARAPDSMWERVTEATHTLSHLPLYIDDQASLRLADVRRKAMATKRRAGGDLLLVIVDYAQMMEGEGQTRAEALANVARGLKRLAKELGCVVGLLSQLSREADKLNGPPRMEHLKESGGIEEAADVVGLLWREARRNPKPDNKHTAQVEFVKHKNGPTDTVHLWFDGETQRFEDAAS